MTAIGRSRFHERVGAYAYFSSIARLAAVGVVAELFDVDHGNADGLWVDGRSEATSYAAAITELKNGPRPN